MTRFVTYDAEVAARIGAAVGMHRVDLRDAADFPRNTNPAILDLIRSPRKNAVMMPSSDDQVLLIQVNDEFREKQVTSRKGKKARKESEIKEIGSQPAGFLGLQDEAVFAEDEEEPPRSLWKQDE